MGRASCPDGKPGAKPPAAIRKPVKKTVHLTFKKNGGGGGGRTGGGGRGGGNNGCCCQSQTESCNLPVQELAETNYLDNALY